MSLKYKIYTKLFPKYIKIPFTSLQLAMWTEDQDWKSMRISLQYRDGTWAATLKPGNYGDKVRLSKYFWKNWLKN